MFLHLVCISIIAVLNHFSMEKNYYEKADYYHEVNLAQREVYTCNYPEALDHFKHAFDKSRPFYHHLKNAILVSIQCGDTKYTENLLVQSIKLKKLTLSTLLKEFDHVLDTAFLIYVFEKGEKIKRDKKTIQHLTFLYDLLDTDKKLEKATIVNIVPKSGLQGEEILIQSIWKNIWIIID